MFDKNTVYSTCLVKIEKLTFIPRICVYQLLTFKTSNIFDILRCIRSEEKYKLLSQKQNLLELVN